MDLKKNNVVFIDQNVSDYTLFLNNVNDVTLPIVYHSSTTREEILSLLTDFSHFDRIAFVFHGIYPRCYYDKPFLENQPYFTLDASENVVVTENVTFIQTILNTYSVSHVDFLGCNLLLSKEWRNYFDLLSVQACIVGASNDNTGNLKYGGDWILENTMEDVRNVYFSSGLDNYSGLLAALTAITDNVTLTLNGTLGLIDNTANTYAWTSPITIGNNIIVRFGGNITVSSVNHYFQINGNNVTIDGGNNIVSISAANYTGLFDFNSQNLVNIQNIIIRTQSGCSLVPQTFHSWLTKYNLTSKFPSNWNLRNCGMTGAVGCTNGSAFTPNSTNLNTCNFYNCYNTTDITGYGGCPGGIVGYANSGNIAFYDCWNSGNIIGSINGGPGGIIGQNSKFRLMSGCYNTGFIGGHPTHPRGGGLGGGSTFIANNNDDNALVINCYNVGKINGVYAGGLFGGTNLFGHATLKTITISNCYNVGEVLNGGHSFINTVATNFNGTINIQNCYILSGNFVTTSNGKTINYQNTYNAGGTWSDSAANANLINTPTSVFSPGTVWTSVASNTPYLLSSYVGNAYNPSSETTSNSSKISPTPTSGYLYQLLNTFAYGTFNTTTGVITFSSIPASYRANVVAYNLINNQYANYFFTSYSLRYLKTPILYYYSLTTPNMGGSIEN